MKKTINYLAVAGFLLIGISSCDNEDAAMPTAEIQIENNLLEVNQSMEVHFTGSADNVVVYPGDTDHDYELREESNSGLVVNKGLFTYAYSTPGVYKVVCVATNHAKEGSIVLSDTCSLYVKVIDDCTEIERISAPQVLYDEVFAQEFNSSDWLLPLPRKIKFKTSTPSVSMSQKLKFYIDSQSTQILIDGNEFNSNSKYDMTKTHEIKTVSNEGTSRTYSLYTLNYGEFKDFTVAGMPGVVERNEYDYSYYEINLKVDSDVDLTSLTPGFTLYSEQERVYVGDAEQMSGVSMVDFSNPVTYRFVVSHPDNPEIKIESKCVVTITK